MLSGKYGRGGLPVADLDRPGGTLNALPAGQLLDIIDCLGEVAREAAASQAQVALAWLLQRPTISTIFLGASSAEQLEENLDALDLQLTGDQHVRLDEVSSRPPPYPHVLQLGIGGERTVRPGGGASNVRVDRALPVPRTKG